MDDMIFRSFPMKKNTNPLAALASWSTDRAEELSWLRCSTQIVQLQGLVQGNFKPGIQPVFCHQFFLGVPGFFFPWSQKSMIWCWKKTCYLWPTWDGDFCPRCFAISKRPRVVFPTKLRNSHRTREFSMDDDPIDVTFALKVTSNIFKASLFFGI